jgi:hypothetical protein
MSRITPAMSDGRSFTNYVSSGIYNTYLGHRLGVPNDTVYREYLQTHADQVMKITTRLMTVSVQPAAIQGVPRPRGREFTLPGI